MPTSPLVARKRAASDSGLRRWPWHAGHTVLFALTETPESFTEDAEDAGTFASSVCPRPPQTGQAPLGLLNENEEASSSSKTMPQSGQALRSESVSSCSAPSGVRAT